MPDIYISSLGSSFAFTSTGNVFVILTPNCRPCSILREKQSGSQKSADKFLESLHIQEEDLQVAARINDQEAIKNLVAQGLGISILSERAARNFGAEKRVLIFELPENTSRRSLYLIYPKNYILNSYLQTFTAFIIQFYAPKNRQI